MGAVDKILSQRLQGGGGFAEGGEGLKGVGDELGGVLFGLLDAVDGGPGGLISCGVLACGLAECRGGLGHVEDVVDDLEGKACLFSERAEAGDGVGGGSGVVMGVGRAKEAAGDDRDGDEGSGLGAVDALDEVGGGRLAAGLDVHDLAADHAGGEGSGKVGSDACADGDGDGLEDGYDGRGGRGEFGDGLEGDGLEGVAGEDGGGFAEDYVAGGLAAAEVVVVEGGKVVVDEGVGVEHLKGRAKGCRAFGEGAPGGHAGCFHAKDGAQTLAAGEGAVSHGAVDGVRLGLGAGKEALEGLVGADGSGGEDVLYGGLRVSHESSIINEGGGS